MPRFDIFKSLTQTTTLSFRQLKALNPLTIHKKGTRTKALFALAMVCFFWGTTWIASKEGVKHMPPLQLAGIRQLLGGLCYVVFFISKRTPFPRGKEWITVIILSILNFVLSNGLSIWGVRYTSAGLGAIMGAVFPLWLVAIGLFSSGSRMPTKAILGFLTGFSGICIIFYDHLNDFLNPDFRFGIFLSLAATWTWAFGTLYTKKKAASFNPYFSLGLQMVISGFFLIVTTRIIDSPSLDTFKPLTEIHLNAWICIAYLVVFGSVLSFIAYLYALQNLPTEQASIYAYVNPIVAVILGWLMFDERITPFLAIGGMVTLLGVYIVNKAFKAIPPVEQPEPEGV
jgi:drug/metabolite transporter (DMT)-like permease